MSYFEPAFSPATTKLVFFDTDPDTLAPMAFRRAPASSRVMPECASIPVSTKVRPASTWGTSSPTATASSAMVTPAARNRSMTDTLSGVRKNSHIPWATFGPTP